MPKDELISDLRSQIDAMEDELNAVTKTQAELHMTIEETRAKHNSATQELTQERKKATTLSVLQVRINNLIRIRIELDSNSIRTRFKFEFDSYIQLPILYLLKDNFFCRLDYIKI